MAVIVLNDQLDGETYLWIFNDDKLTAAKRIVASYAFRKELNMTMEHAIETMGRMESLADRDTDRHSLPQ